MSRAIPALTVLALLAPGCRLMEGIRNIREAVEGVTEPVVLGATAIGVSPPSDPRVAFALSQTELASGARLTAYLADASAAGSIEDAPITGEALSVRFAGGEIGLVEEEGGRYAASGADGFEYVAETLATVSLDGGQRSVEGALAPDPDFVAPARHTPGAPIVVDLSGQDVDGVLVMVLDLVTGETVWENTPRDPMELFTFATSGGASVVEVPGEVFETPGLFALGVAGTWNADSESVVGVNTALSSFFSARFRFDVVCTLGDAALCAADPAEGL